MRRDNSKALHEPPLNDLFIVTTSPTKPQGAARQLIRRHVMRGKNRRKPTESIQPGSWVNTSSSSAEGKAGEVGIQDAMPLPHPRLMPGSTLESWRWPMQMQPYMLEAIYRFCTILKQSLYPIEICCHFDPSNAFWLQFLSADAAFLHSCLWTTEAYADFLKARPISRTTLYHENRTLELLQQKLNDPSQAASDFSIAVVVTLVMMTCLTGNHVAAVKHMEGLHQMVMLRGGLEQIKQNTQLQIKVADLSAALVAGSKPLFFSEGISSKAFLPKPASLPQFFTSHDIDPRLVTISADLSQFCNSANIAFRSDLKIEPALFQEILISIQYRLMVIDFDKHGFNETLRLGLLAFSTTVFLQTAGVKIRFATLSTQLRNLLAVFDWRDETSGAARLWVLFMTAISAVTDQDDTWLMPQLGNLLQVTGCHTWSDALAMLKALLWIDVLLNTEGERIFRKAALRKS